MKRVALLALAACGAPSAPREPAPHVAAARSASTLPPLPPVKARSVSTRTLAHYRREEDLTFEHAATTARLVLVERDRSNAWFTKDHEVAITSGGAKGSLLAHGTARPIDVADGFFVEYAPDEHAAAIIQARAPLTIVSVPGAKLTYDRGQGRECGVRWASATSLVFHDDGNDAALWRLDPASRSLAQLGGTRRADQCWASADGKRWFVRDDFARPGGVVWKVDGDTGNAAVWIEGFSSVVGTRHGERLCYARDDGLYCRGENEPEERIADEGAGLKLDDTGRSLVFSVNGITFVADTRDKTVRALAGVRGKSGGNVAILDGGRVFAAGSASGVELWDLDRRTDVSVSGSGLYGVEAIPGRPRALLVERERGGGHDLFLLELPR